MNGINATLYGVDSPNVVKVVIMLEEIAKPYDLRFVSVFKGEQFTPEFLALNPLGKVPVLVDPELDRPLASTRPAVMRAKQRVFEAFEEHSRRSRETASAADLDRLFGRTATMPELDYSWIMGKK